MPLFLKFIIFLTFIHTIQSHSVHPSPFAEARLLESSLRLRSARGASMGCRTEIRTRACLTASRRTTNWAAPHPYTLNDDTDKFQIIGNKKFLVKLSFFAGFITKYPGESFIRRSCPFITCRHPLSIHRHERIWSLSWQLRLHKR